MAESENIIQKPENNASKAVNIPAKPKKKRRIFKFLVLLSTLFLLMIALLVAFTQSGIFKDILRSYLLGKFNEELAKKESFLSCKSISGNFFSEIILDSASLKVQRDEMVKFDHIKITYDIFKLFNKQVNIYEIQLQNPSANLLKVKNAKGDSVWNFTYLLSSEEEKPKTTTPFEWKISVNRLKIENLNLLMLGSKPQDGAGLVSEINVIPSKNFDINNLKISSLNIETGIYYDSNSTQLQIRKLNFNSNFGFDLKGLSGNFYISRSRAEINMLNIETSKSWVQMDYAFIDNIDLLSIKDLSSFKDKDIKLSMVTKNFDFADLKSFLPAVNFLDKDVYCSINARGKFDNIQIDKLVLKTVNSNFNFTGTMANLTNPGHLQFDIDADNIIIDPIDTRIYTPGLPIPDYSYLGKVFADFTYKGEPLNFQSTFDIKSSAGSAKGFYNMNLTVPNFSYNSSVEASGLNIGKIVKDPNLESNINGKADFSGSGFTLASIDTKITYEINNTKIYEQNIDKSAGTVTLRNYNVDLNVTYSAKNLNTETAGTINISDLKNPKYSLKGKVNNLNIEDFTKSTDDKSSLDFTFDVNGSGISEDNLQGTYNFQFANSQFGNYKIPATPVDLKISMTGSDNYINFSSNIIDFNAKGSFKIGQIAPVITENINLIMNEVSRKFALDTLMPVKTVSVSNSNMDFTYEIKTKNTEALKQILEVHNVSFAGNINGHIINSPTGFDAASNLQIDNFKYSDTVLVLKNTKADFSFNNNYTAYQSDIKNNFSSFTTIADIYGDTIKSGKNIYDSVNVKLRLINGNQYFNIAGKMDTISRISITGNLKLNQDSIELVIPKLDFLYNDITAKNDSLLLVTYNPYAENKPVTFDDFNIISNYLKFNVSGYYSLNSESDLTAEADAIDIPELIETISNPRHENSEEQEIKSEKDAMVKGDIRRLSLNYKGVLHNPVLSLEMNSGLLRYQNSKIGRMDAFIDYNENILSTDILVSNAQGLGRLRVTGDIPYNNPLVPSDSISYSDISKRPANLIVKADNFQINFFSRLIPNFADLRGLLDGRISTSGTISDPLFSGSMRVDKGRFFSEVNGLFYRFNSNIIADKSDFDIDKFSLYYEDDDARHIDIWGKINFAGLKLNYIDLNTSGDVKILDRSSPTNRFGFYGDMIAGIGTPSITIKGDLNNLVVAGKLVVKNANLIFPSLHGLAYNIYEDNFTYRILTDSTGNNYLDTEVVISPTKLNEIDPFLLYSEILEEKPPSPIDFITFDLEVETEKNVYVSITFNTLTSEAMFGEIQGKMLINNKTFDKRFQFFGNMNIVGDSYYRYYKNFAISNSSIVFEGDPINPRINIHAEYTNARTVDNNIETMYIILDITGTRKDPKLVFSLRDAQGVVTSGDNAQSDAFSYLLFGQPVSSSYISIAHTGSVLGSLGSSTGSGILSALLLSAIRDVAPFIINTEVNYTGGNVSQGTDIRITSELGGAIVKFGGKVLSDINNAEVSIDYPLNKLLNINISNNLMLEIYRQIRPGEFTGDRTVQTGLSLIYKINF